MTFLSPAGLLKILFRSSPPPLTSVKMKLQTEKHLDACYLNNFRLAWTEIKQPQEVVESTFLTTIV